MKITIIGGGLCGLYIAYLLKKVNIDYEIYEKSNRPGDNLKNIKIFGKDTSCGNRFILPYHLNMINLLNTLKIKYVTVSGKKLLSLTNLDEKTFNNILNKILNTYKKDLPTNIPAIVYIKSILSDDEYAIFKENLFIEQFLKNEISDFMKYLFHDLKLSNKVMCDNNKDNCVQNNYIKIPEIEGTNAIINKLARYVQEKLNLNHNVQEITYMPITNSYLLLINDKLVQADRLIIATNISIKYITLNIPNVIKNNLNYIKPIKIIKLYTLHNKPIELKKDRVIQTQSIITNIMIHDSNILESTFIANSSNNSLLINKNRKEVIQILNKLFENITGIKFPKIIDYKFCKYNYGAHYNTKIIKTNFWNSHNLVFAGEFVHPYHGWMEGSVMSALDTYKIVTKDLFIDKLKR